MAYDEELARRFHEALGLIDGGSEKKMMGGICFLSHGNMIGGASRDKDGQGWFMFRVGKDNEAEALTRPGAEILSFNDRKMGGMIKVLNDECNDDQLKEWIALAMDFVGQLPPKEPKAK